MGDEWERGWDWWLMNDDAAGGGGISGYCL